MPEQEWKIVGPDLEGRQMEIGSVSVHQTGDPTCPIYLGVGETDITADEALAYARALTAAAALVNPVEGGEQ